jgi:tetratricopeptide (TPR) repeat protein
MIRTAPRRLSFRVSLWRFCLLLGAGGGILPAGAQAPATCAVPATQVAACAGAPGRPAWAPLEMLWGRREWREALVARLQDQDATERARAALALGLTGAVRAEGDLAGALSDSDPQVRRCAGLGLCYLGDARGETEAGRALTEGEVWERSVALVGLWRVNTAETRDLLTEDQAAQGPFLQTLIPQALHSAPWKPTPPYPSRQTDTPAPASGDGLWEQVADTLSSGVDYWWHKGDYDQCCQVLDQTLFFSPHRVDDYGNAAWLQWSMGRDAVAIRELERGLALNPDDWLAHFNLGFHYWNTKRYALALPYLQYAGAHCDSWFEPQHVYAHDLEALGRRQDAVKAWQDALRRFPHDPTAQQNLTRVQAAG